MAGSAETTNPLHELVVELLEVAARGYFRLNSRSKSTLFGGGSRLEQHYHKEVNDILDTGKLERADLQQARDMLKGVKGLRFVDALIESEISQIDDIKKRIAESFSKK